MLFYMKDWKIFVVIAFDERSRRFDGSVGSWIESIWSGSLPQFSDLLRSRTLITVPKLQSPLLLDPLSTMLILELAWSMDVLFGNQKFTITFLFLLAEYGGNWQGLCLWWTLNRQPRNILCWHFPMFYIIITSGREKIYGLSLSNAWLLHENFDFLFLHFFDGTLSKANFNRIIFD